MFGGAFWRVFDEDGKYFGMFPMREDDTVLQLDEKTVKKFKPKPGTTLYIHSTGTTNQAWGVRITGNYNNIPTEFTITKVAIRKDIANSIKGIT